MVAPTNRAISRGLSSSSVPEPDEDEDPELQDDLESFRAWLITQSGSKAGGKTAVVQNPQPKPTVEPAVAPPSEPPQASIPSKPCDECSKNPCN